MILCCQCATPIEPNAANMCINCIKSQTNISSDIPTQLTIHSCKNCSKYLQPPNSWIKAAPESRELLSLLLRRLKLPRLIDASFIWTEPHSKRLKVKLTIQKEVFNVIIQQNVIVEFIVNTMMCSACMKLMSANTWEAVVQVRNTKPNLEQLILDANAHKNVINIKQVKEGLDFYFSSKGHAVSFVQFIQSVMPCKSTSSESIISADVKTSTAVFKYTFTAEICPVNKFDLVVKGGRLCMVCSVKSTIELLDLGNFSKFNVHDYWKHPFYSVISNKCLSKFYVIEIETAPGNYNFVTVTKDYVKQYIVKTHLILKEGDLCYGFDLENSNVYSNSDFDVVLCKKGYEGKKSKGKKRRERGSTRDTMSVTTRTSLDLEIDDMMDELGLEEGFEGEGDISGDVSMEG